MVFLRFSAGFCCPVLCRQSFFTKWQNITWNLAKFWISCFALHILLYWIFFQSMLDMIACIEMVFCYQNCSSQRWRPRICQIFEITRTIYSNSERSEQNAILTCSWRFLISNRYSNWKKLLGFRNMQEKLENKFSLR